MTASTQRVERKRIEVVLVQIGNNSQLNNSPAWAVVLPRTITTSVMSLGQPTYRTISGLGDRLDSRGSGKQQVADVITLFTATNQKVNPAAMAVSEHYQPNNHVLRPGKRTSQCQAAKAKGTYQH